MPATLESRWPEIGATMHGATKEGTRKAAEKMKSRIIGELYKPKSGRNYRGHTASAPGETPASDSKALENSLEVVPEGETNHAVESSAEHAKHLEFSTRRMAARPLFNPVAEQMVKEVPDIIEAEIRARVK